MPTTITVRKLYIKEGTGKNGKPYRLLRLLADDGKYYSTFSAIANIAEGSQLTIECRQGRNPDSFDITKVIAHALPNAQGPSRRVASGGAGLPGAAALPTQTGGAAQAGGAEPTTPVAPQPEPSLQKKVHQESPQPLSDPEIEGILSWAESKAATRLGIDTSITSQKEAYEDMRFLDLATTLFNAKLQQQDQRFRAASQSSVQSAKLANIRQVQEGRA